MPLSLKSGLKQNVLVSCNPKEKRREIERQERDKESELQPQEIEKQMEHEQQQREYEKIKQDLEKIMLALDHRCQVEQDIFDVNKYFSFVPRFDPEKA